MRDEVVGRRGAGQVLVEPVAPGATSSRTRGSRSAPAAQAGVAVHDDDAAGVHTAGGGGAQELPDVSGAPARRRR